MSFLDSRKSIISVSLLIAVVLIVGAYVLSGHAGSPGIVSAESTDALLKAYAAKDSDNDGLPDWEEALYGTDPNNAHSVRADLTDGEAVAQGLATPRYAGQAVATTTVAASTINASQIPGPTAASDSLTQQFAVLFYNNYITTRGDKTPTAAQMQTFAQNAVAELIKTQVRPDAFTATSVKVSSSGAQALASYAAQAEGALGQNASHLPYDEITYFSDAVNKNDSQALKNVSAISDAYLKTAQALSKLSVPQEAASAHLALINAMARLGGTIGDLAALQTDPIRAMVGLGSYEKDSATFTAVLVKMNAVFVADGVTISSGTPGFAFYDVLQFAVKNATSTPSHP